MSLRRRAAIGAAILGLPALLAGEAWLASRVERIDGFTAAELDGHIGGDGPALRLTWIGDSTGSGVGASAPEHALPHLVARGLGRPVDLRVLAVSGATVADALREQLPALAATRPHWVVVAIGNNDVTHLTPRSRFRARLDTLLRGIEAERVIVLGTAAFAGTPLLKQPLRALAGLRSRRLDAIVREVAAAHGAVYVPIREMTGARFAAEPNRYHARDGFHPNDAGYALWADATLAVLTPAPPATTRDT